jgi:spore maturation protein CgeB
MLAVKSRGYRIEAASYLPYYDNVSFASRQDFETRIAQFLNDPQARAQIATDQRQRVIDTLTYDAVLEDILDFAAEYFASKTPADRHLAPNPA